MTNRFRFFMARFSTKNLKIKLHIFSLVFHCNVSVLFFQELRTLSAAQTEVKSFYVGKTRIFQDANAMGDPYALFFGQLTDKLDFHENPDREFQIC